MSRNQLIVKTVLTVFIVFALEILVRATDDLRPSVPGNDYVLRSCMSSVELNRRDIHHPGTKSRATLHSPRKRTVNPPAMQYATARYNVKPVESGARGKSQQKLEKRIFRRGRPGRQMLTDTPLTTLMVQRRGRKDAPQLYVKKDLLPEIKSSIADDRRDENNDASIIVIESVPRRSSK